MKRLLTTLLALVLLFAAQANDEKEYSKFAEELKQQIWSSTSAEFTNYYCPDNYVKDFSAVILASRTDVELTRKSYIKFTGMGFGGAKKLGRHELTRMLIKLNDEAAIKKFSEFDYYTFKKSYTMFGQQESELKVLGVRVIKPSGNIVNVNTNDYMVTREGSNDSEVSHKLAVPGLGVGDVLDIFFFNEEIVHDRNMKPFTFVMKDEYPILHYKVRCVIDKKITVQYRTFNGAPDFKVSTDKDKHTILETEINNINGVIPGLWYNKAQQAPMILLYAYDKSVTGGGIKSVKDEDRGLQANPDFRNILIDDFTLLKYEVDNAKRSRYYKAFGFLKKDIDIAKKTADKEAAAQRLYNAFVYYICGFDRDKDPNSPYQFVAALWKMFLSAEIPRRLVVTTNSNNEPLEQLINNQNTTWLLKTPGGAYYTFPNYKCQTPGVLPAELYGRKAAVVHWLDNEKTEYSIEDLPQVDYQNNRDMVKLNASIDGTTVNVDRTETLSGTQKEIITTLLISDQLMMDDYDRLLKRENNYLDALPKKDRKGVEDKFEKDKESQDEIYKDEVELYHDIRPLEFKSFEVISTGLDPQNPDFSYRSQYTLDGLIKKAGDNLVVSVGKLLGSQLSIEGHERERDCDIYRNSANQLLWDINVEIPNGYSISQESLVKLQQSVKSEVGEFTSSADVEGNTLHLQATKSYFKSYYPLSKWQELLKVIDAANDFTNRQIVFKK
ncbi:MAG: DUF3857 domain-containing protein [Muribaculaceae bacterium]|nr:DUF3857 domain-containing protein [Muribaculaceae bacterium]